MVELLVVVAIVAVLASVAAPFFGDLIARSSTANALGALDAALIGARGEALRRGQPVTVCRSGDGSACSTAAAGSFAATDWAVGWIVFADANGNGARDKADMVVQTQAPLNDGAGQRVAIVGSAATVTFLADGLRPAAAAQATFDVSQQNAGSDIRSPRCLIVSPPGQLSRRACACAATC